MAPQCSVQCGTAAAGRPREGQLLARDVAGTGIEPVRAFPARGSVLQPELIHSWPARHRRQQFRAPSRIPPACVRVRAKV